MGVERQVRGRDFCPNNENCKQKAHLITEMGIAPERTRTSTPKGHNPSSCCVCHSATGAKT